MKKRILAVTDLHCGHLVGLTPPAWHIKRPSRSTTKRSKWAKIQEELWCAFEALLAKHAPYDLCLSAGDLIDGQAQRSGSSELITSDREEQADMAVECFNTIRLFANKGYEVIGCYGTAYHVGAEEDWENIIAARAGFKKMGSHEWVRAKGTKTVIDLKHQCGSSQYPHTSFTAVAAQRLHNLLWAERKAQPKADIILRGHVHRHSFCGQPGWLAMTLPALQGMGTKYGARRCSGLVDWGITVIDVDDKGGFDWTVETVLVDSQRAKVVSV